MSDAGLAAPSGRIQARPLDVSERGAASARLAAQPRHNLLLLDMADRVGSQAAPGEMPSEVVAARRDGALVALAALRPSVVLEPAVEPGVLEALEPFLDSIATGLVKTALPGADALWRRLSRGGRRRAVVDRIETAYAVDPGALRPAPPPPGGARIRRATRNDLDNLVFAARESLREESRPDPFRGDPRGFRRWVRGRIPRALLVESGGRVAFVGYADVQRPEGWLIQGVYTWPEVRRRGLAAAGVAALCEQAFAAGAEHVQLAVVDGNDPGRRLYETLGFQPFAKLRTVLFT